jgi:hypothetical protein
MRCRVLGSKGANRCCSTYRFIGRVQKYVEYRRAGAEENSLSDSQDSAYLLAVEQGTQCVGDATLPAFQCRRYPRIQSLTLFRGISSEIDCGRLPSIRPSPQGHFPDIPRGLPHPPGTGMPPDMR